MQMVPVQKVLMTAGAAGIGREIALAFVKAGARVHVVDVDAAGLNALRADSLAISTEVCDLADFAAIEKVIPQAIETLGGLDVLVNNAGIAGPTALVENYDPREWDRVMQVNLGATFNVTRLAIPHLRRNLPQAASSTCPPPRAVSAIRNAAPTPPANGESSASRRHCRWNWVRMVFAPMPSCPGAVAGPRMERVLEGRASTSGRTLEQERVSALANQSSNFHRTHRDRGAGVVPGIGCCQDHLGSGTINRRGHAPLRLAACLPQNG